MSRKVQWLSYAFYNPVFLLFYFVSWTPRFLQENYGTPCYADHSSSAPKVRGLTSSSSITHCLRRFQILMDWHKFGKQSALSIFKEEQPCRCSHYILTPWVSSPPLPLYWLCQFSSVQFSHSVVSISLWLHGLQPARLLYPWNFPGKCARVGSHSLLQRIFLTNRLNPGLLHYRQILYYLSHQEAPSIQSAQIYML